LTPAHPGSGPARVWAEVVGGDALRRGNEPVLCWWLPEGSSVQHAYRLRTDDGFDTGRVGSRTQSFVRLPVFDRSRRSATVHVKVWTDLGESEWSDPVGLEAGLLEDDEWSARWIGVEEGRRPGKGSRPAYWLRKTVDVPPFSQARLYVTALGLYEAFLDGRRVGDAELAPGYTQYRAGSVARVAQPLQQGRGGHVPAPLRRGPAPHPARVPHVRGAAAARRRHHLRQHAAHQPVRAHRGVLASRCRGDGG
jgi:Alpha-L-rhamnosidase N-terminal domain